jgi:hypothetical protein
VVNLFERLAQGQPQQAKETTKQQLKNTDRVSRWKRKTDAEIFLTDVLANGPMPTAVIEELGAARRFSKKQLEKANRHYCIQKERETPRLLVLDTRTRHRKEAPQPLYSLPSRPLEKAGLPTSANRQTPSPESAHVGGDATNSPAILLV